MLETTYLKRAKDKRVSGHHQTLFDRTIGCMLMVVELQSSSCGNDENDSVISLQVQSSKTMICLTAKYVHF
jgi:hypothetical protein